MKQKAVKIGITSLVLVLALGGLLYSTLSEGTEFYKHVDEVMVNPEAWHGKNLQLHGFVVKDSILRKRDSLEYRLALAFTLGLPTNKVRVITQPHGGSFGGKGNPRGLSITALLSRQAGGRAVNWIEDRMEYLVAGGSQSWDRHYEASLAVKADGTVTGLKVSLVDNLGATAEGAGAISTGKPLAAFTGCYTIPVAQYDLTIVATNKLYQTSYRGMGPPPHFWVLEQMMDVAARGLAMDPAEFRRKNFIPADCFPYTIPSGNESDSTPTTSRRQARSCGSCSSTSSSPARSRT